MGSDVAFTGAIRFASTKAFLAFLDDQITYAHVDPEAATPDPCSVRSLMDRELLEQDKLGYRIFWARVQTKLEHLTVYIEGHVERSSYLNEMQDTLRALLLVAERNGAVGDLVEIDEGRSWGMGNTIGDEVPALARHHAIGHGLSVRQLDETEIGACSRSERFAPIWARLQRACEEMEQRRAANPPAPPPPPPPGSFLDHAMRMIAGRAIPDARDGMKRVERRILWALHPDGAVSGLTAQEIEARVRARHPDPGAVKDALRVLVGKRRTATLSLVDDKDGLHCLSPVAAEALAELALEDPAAFSDGAASDTRALSLPVPWLLIAGSTGIAVGLKCEIAPSPPDAVLRAILDRLASPPRSPPDLVVASDAMVLVDGKPAPLDTSGLIDAFLAHRRETLALRRAADVDARIRADSHRWLA